MAASCGRASRRRRAVTGIRSIPSSARSRRIRARGRSPSSSPAPAPTARSACASSRPKVASRWHRIPNSAAFPGMPQSAIGTGIVDLVLPPDQMPEVLLEIARHGYVRAPAETTTRRPPRISEAATHPGAPEHSAGLPQLQSARSSAASTGAWASSDRSDRRLRQRCARSARSRRCGRPDDQRDELLPRSRGVESSPST